MKFLKRFYCCLIILCALVSNGCDTELKCTPDVPELTEQEGHIPYYFPGREAFGDLRDGEYTGKINCGLDSGNIAIVVEDDTVMECEIIWLLVSPQVYEEGPGEEILENGCDFILEAQSPQFDAVTGATGSSHALKISITRALWEAAGKEDPMAECVPLNCK